MLVKSRQPASLQKRITLAVLGMIIAASSSGAVLADNNDQPKLHAAKTVRKQSMVKSLPPSSPDTLLVMPNAKEDQDETFEALKEVHGTIIGTIGEGRLTTLIVKTEKGKLEETEKKLAGDKHFSAVQRNFISEGQVHMMRTVPDDPYLGWELPAVGVTPRGWTKKRGGHVAIAIADSGCQYSNPDLFGKCFTGYDAVRDVEGNGITDIDLRGSHGTVCASAAAARTNNGRLSAAPAGDAYIYPIRVAYQSGGKVYTDDTFLMRAIRHAARNGVRILNISYGANDARYSFANAKAHPALHEYLKWYHDQCNGMVFFAAGNEDQFDPNPRLPYMMMVSAMDSRYRITRFSNWGNPVWFIAPGQDLSCSDRNGRLVRATGTSFSSPMVAGIAAVILSKNRNLSNRQVEAILVHSCGYSGRWINTSFGFGLPNVERALALTP